jgi:hypothetical protein
VTWRDLNGDNIAEDNELGAANNATLGLRRNINPDPNIKRPYQILVNAGVQQQLLPGVSVSANYYRRQYKELIYTTNLAVPVASYTLVNLPDPRGNGQTLPVYNLAAVCPNGAACLGQVNELDTTSPNNRRWYNGFDLTVNGRGKNGATLAGGMNVGHTIQVVCDVEDPNALRFCDQSQYKIPWSTTVKINGSYPLPYGFRLSGVFQSADGYGPTSTSGVAASGYAPVTPDSHDVLNYYIVNRTVLPSLSQTQVNVLLDPPGASWMPRVTQLDFSLSKSFKVRGSFTLTPQLDVFNALNANTALTQVTTFGGSLGNPSTILTGRLVRFQVKTLF